MSERTDDRRIAAAIWRHRPGLIAGLVLVAAGPMFWLLSSRFWLVDLAANLAPQLALFAIVICAFCVAFRQKMNGAVWLIAAMSCLSLLLGSPRAPRATLDVSGDRDVSILIFNATTRNPNPDRVKDLLHAHRADVAIVLEAPAALISAIRDDRMLEVAYAYWQLPTAAGAGFPVALSRWPFTRLRASDVFEDTNGRLPGMIIHVERPQGAFELVMFHPRSPRTRARWEEGNDLVRLLVEYLHHRREQVSHPILVGGDFNASPTGWRSRAITWATGYRRAKPTAYPSGTWPSQLPWPLKVAIDDAMLPPDVSVRRWRILEAAGSDHQAVLIDAVIPE